MTEGDRKGGREEGQRDEGREEGREGQRDRGTKRGRKGMEGRQNIPQESVNICACPHSSKTMC